MLETLTGVHGGNIAFSGIEPYFEDMIRVGIWKGSCLGGFVMNILINPNGSYPSTGSN